MYAQVTWRRAPMGLLTISMTRLYFLNGALLDVFSNWSKTSVWAECFGTVCGGQVLAKFESQF